MLSMKTLYSLGHNLQPLPWRLEEFVILKDIISRPFKYFEQNGIICPPITFDKKQH